MIIVGTGITGVGRTHYLNGVRDYAASLGGSMDVADIGPKMFEKASSLRINIPHNKILNLDITTLSFLRATVFEEITSNIDNYRGLDRDLLVSLHMSFRWNKVLMPAFDYYYLNRLKPNLTCIIVDSVANILKRMMDTPDLNHWMDRLNLKEILIWQDEELFITKMVSDIMNIPFYMIPSSSHPSLMYDIINYVEKPRSIGDRPKKLRAYISYPMTMVKGDEGFEEDRLELVRRLKEKGLIIFDPVMIEDMMLLELVKEVRDKNTIYIEDLDIRIGVRDILEAERYIIDQTVYRDYKFIDQSDMIIIYYPIKELSAGVLSEMIYASTHMKDVYTLYTHKDISPFFLNYSTKVFRDIDETIEYIGGLMEAKAE